MSTQVVNRHFEPYDVYIGRGTKWGNPFKEGKDGTREEVIELYRQYARNNPEIVNSLDELRGKRLGCSCKPQPCHGDVLVEMINMKKYNILYVDPPWDFGNKFRSGKKREDGKITQHSITEKYPTMSIEELKGLREFANKITTKNSVLFMWTTDAHLKSALEVMEAWGYTYKTIAFIWNKKEKSGKQVCYMGMWTMKGSEICLLGTKGNPHKFLKSRKVRQLVEAERGRHSEKPQEVRNRIVEMFGENAKYLELFAREKVYPFDVWGNEVKSDV